MSKRILVAGGGGFLGSHLCEHLLSAGHDVFCIDDFRSGRFDNIESFSDSNSFTLINDDICDGTSLPPVDHIYHLASRASPSDFTRFPLEIALSNTKGTHHLLDHAAACDARFLLASTSEVYGEPEIHPQPETYNGNVNLRGPRGVYDESKRFGETLTSIYHREKDVDTRTVRIFNTYGPRMRSDDGRAVPTFISQALADGDVTVYGDGSQTRCFCYVDDLVRGITSVMELKRPQHRVFNLGHETEYAIIELAKLIVDLVDSASTIVHQPLPEDDPTHRKPDVSRAKSNLDWEPRISLCDGLQMTISHFKTDENMGK